MVAKITSGSSAYGVLKYNMDKLDRQKADVLFTNNILAFDAKGKADMFLMEQSLETYLQKNPRIRKGIFHVSLNPHPDDKLTDEQLVAISKCYMEKMGMKDQPFIVFKHRDIDRHHIHIVSTWIDENGKRINDSFCHQRSKQICEAIEKTFNLHPAVSNDINEVKELKKIDYEKGNLKKHIKNTVKLLLDNYSFQSVKEFRTLLSLYNITVEEVKGAANGVPYQGLVYSAINSKGEKVGRQFKASLFGKDCGYKALYRCIDKSKQHWKNAPDAKNKLKNAIRLSRRDSRDLASFKKEMNKRNVDVIFKFTTDDKLYGITFIDHTNKIVVNGSRLGKEFSANTFNDLWEDKNQQKNQVINETTGQANNVRIDPFGWLAALIPDGVNSGEENENMNLKKKKRKRKI